MVASRADHLGIRPLWDGAVDFLRDDRRDDGLYSFSAQRRGEMLVRNFDHPQTLRYTINSLLGLQAAARATPHDARLADVPALVEEFVARWETRTTHPADLGLLTVLLCDGGDDEGAAVTLGRAAVRTLGMRPSRLDVQTLGWVLWGAAAATRRGIAGAADTATALLRRLCDELVDPRTGLPRHTVQRYRGGILSFGGLVYYLRGLYEAGLALGDERADDLFRAGTRRALELQGSDGGWPWMIDAATGRVFDRYPLFTVHQDAMSMLFLHPAAARGIDGADDACARSVRWALGGNDLNLRMYADTPSFVAYRAIQRAELLPRARRYARWLHGEEDVGPAPRVHVNRECRSYHLGWLLYAWSDDMRPAA
jgi:hypothetical protein